MLHRSNAEHSLWNGRGSRGEAAGKSWGGAQRRTGVGTWPGAVFSPVRGSPEGGEDLP